MTAEGRLAEFGNRPAEASEAYLNVIRLGYAISRGGLLIDSLVGIAVEAIGTVNMERLAPKLDAKQCREATTVLESCQGLREPTQSIVAREHAWGRRAYGLKGQLARLVNFRSMQQSEQKIVSKFSCPANPRAGPVDPACLPCLRIGKRRAPEDPRPACPDLPQGHPPKPDHRHQHGLPVNRTAPPKRGLPRRILRSKQTSNITA